MTLQTYAVNILGTKSKYQLHIPGRLPGLNEYTNKCRTDPRAGARMKRDAQEGVMWQIIAQMRQCHFEKPVFLLFIFYEKDRRRDKDNVSSFARKVIQDALCAAASVSPPGGTTPWAITPWH